MAEKMKPAGAWGWTVTGGKNPKNAETLKEAGIDTTRKDTKKEQPKKETKKDKKPYYKS